MNIINVVYYESIKWELKRRLIYEYRYDERLNTKNEESTRLVDTELVVELEYLKTKTRLNCVCESLVPFLITFDEPIHVCQLHFYCVLSLWINKVRGKEKTYIWVSVWWKTKNFELFIIKSIKWELKTRPIYECRSDERLKTKAEESTRLAYTNKLFVVYYESMKRKLI